MAALCDEFARRPESREHESDLATAGDEDPGELEITGSMHRVWKDAKHQTLFGSDPALGLHNIRPSVDTVEPTYKEEFKDDRAMEAAKATEYARMIREREQGFEKARTIWEKTDKSKVWHDDEEQLHPDVPEDVARMRKLAQREAEEAEREREVEAEKAKERTVG